MPPDATRKINPVEVIVKKRDGHALDDDEISGFIRGFTAGTIPEYQCSAFMMAVCWRGMNARETAVLTSEMTKSGIICDHSDVPGPKVDKHSTGGVGDKTSLLLAPIVASLGGVVPMMSGRGLAHTGGTLDKLESIPGFRVSLSSAEFKAALRDVGAAIISTTPDMAPADRKMYALRDVTGTVPSIPLIAGSIMCKKLAENPDSLVLDVKTGTGAFMSEQARAQSFMAQLSRNFQAILRAEFTQSSDGPIAPPPGGRDHARQADDRVGRARRQAHDRLRHVDEPASRQRGG